MKKLIGIGVALALVALVVLPIGAAAQCDYEGITPTTYAKIPFTIIGSGLYLMENILGTLVTAGLLPDTLSWLPDLMVPIGDWAMGPLSWTVDMLAWGLALGGTVVSELGTLLPALGIDLGMDIGPLGDLINTVACALFQPFSCNVTGAAFTPCA